MENPWSALGGYHIHPDDKWLVDQHNTKHRSKPAYQIERGLPPLPYTGDPRTARVILLAKNANYSPEDEADADTRPDLLAENEAALIFASRRPFFYLDERFEGTTGYAWWRGVVGSLVDAAAERASNGGDGGEGGEGGDDGENGAGAENGADWHEIAGRIACLQSHPYRSRDSFDPKEPFPTQAWTDHLAVEAAARPGVIFVLLGGEPRWKEVIPSVFAADAPAPVVRLKTVRKPFVTPGNVKTAADWERLVAALAAS